MIDTATPTSERGSVSDRVTAKAARAHLPSAYGNRSSRGNRAHRSASRQAAWHARPPAAGDRTSARTRRHLVRALRRGPRVIGHLFVWASAERQFPEISHDIIAPALMFAWFAWLLHALNTVARRSFNEFRPALGDPHSEARYESELTTVRDRDALFAGIVAIVIVAAFYYLAVRPVRQVIPPEIERVSAPLWGIAVFVLGIVVIHTINQLRLVSHLSAVARNVDIFKPATHQRVRSVNCRQRPGPDRVRGRLHVLQPGSGDRLHRGGIAAPPCCGRLVRAAAQRHARSPGRGEDAPEGRVAGSAETSPGPATWRG